MVIDFSKAKNSFEKMEEERLGFVRRSFSDDKNIPDVLKNKKIKIREIKIRENIFDFKNETLERLAADCEEISDRIFVGRSFNEIKDITWLGADFHNHGRCSLRIKTDQGIFYYKPRESGMDGLYCRIVDRWFNDVTSAPKLIIRNSYSYVSEVTADKLDPGMTVAGYYHNFGVLLALLRSLGSTDIHAGNIIACADKPVIIDMETMLTPELDIKWAAPSPKNYSPDEYIRQTFLDTCVLPSMLLGGAQMSPLYNLDIMNNCLPSDGCIVSTVEGYEDEFIAGFREGYSRVIKIKKELIGLLNENHDITFRYVLRPTAYYERILDRLLEPEALTCPEKREEIYDRLIKRFANNEETDIQKIKAWEKASLEECDFPYYRAKLDSKDLYGDMNEAPIISGCFEKSALEHAKTRLDIMSNEEECFEEALMRLCFKHTDRAYGWFESKPEQVHDENPAPLTFEIILNEADRIVRHIEELMITTPAGRHVWFCGLNARDMGIGNAALKNGCGGIALFLKKYLAHEGAERSTAATLLKICIDEVELYRKFYNYNADKQLYPIDDLDALMRCLYSSAFDTAEVEHILFDDTGKKDDTDIVSGGRAGIAGNMLLQCPDSDLLKSAGDILSGMVADKIKTGQYITRVWPFYNSEDPSFSFGESGIGYVLLWYMELAEKHQ